MDSLCFVTFQVIRKPIPLLTLSVIFIIRNCHHIWTLTTYLIYEYIEQKLVPIIATVIKTYENGKRWWPTTSIELPAVVKNDEPKYSITKYDPVDGTNVKLVSWGYDWSYQNKRRSFYRWQFCRLGKLSTAFNTNFTISIGPRIRRSQQGDAHNKLCW